MTILTVTARGQVTFRKDVLQHLGINPGGKIELDKLPDGRVALRAARPSGTIDAFPQALLSAGNVAVNRPAAEAGLAMFDAGGDFADGLIAFEGKWLGGDTFVSFDKKAVALLEKQGQATTLLVR